MSWNDLLTTAAGFILVGVFLVGLYEALALISLHVPFIKSIPLITDIVRPWVAKNKDLALLMAAVALAAQFWTFFHFFLGL